MAKTKSKFAVKTNIEINAILYIHTYNTALSFIFGVSTISVSLFVPMSPG